MDNYNKLTSIFNYSIRYRFPYSEKEINKNGIYIMFELGEKHNKLDRIVRIGSHTGRNRLYERINDHYVGEDHRDSIFRKHIGRCLLTINSKVNYIKNWDLKIKKREDKEKNLDKIDRNLEKIYEGKITSYIKGCFSFTIIPNVFEVEKRIRLEAGLIATFAQYDKKQISDTWLGKYHPDIKISNSGLWNIHHLNAGPLIEEELDYIINKMSILDKL